MGILRLFRPAALALTLALAACASVVIDSGERSVLVAASQKWDARGFRDYSIESRSGCFCPTELNEWARIEVVNGTVQRATILSTSEVITDSRLAFWQSVEDLFYTLITTTKSEAIADITFTIDPTFGYPNRVTWIEKANVADAGGTRELRNPQALPNSQ